jgi:hypothetical protein
VESWFPRLRYASDGVVDRCQVSGVGYNAVDCDTGCWFLDAGFDSHLRGRNIATLTNSSDLSRFLSFRDSNFS